jgi:hypothetical protein
MNKLEFNNKKTKKPMDDLKKKKYTPIKHEIKKKKTDKKDL